MICAQKQPGWKTEELTEGTSGCYYLNETKTSSKDKKGNKL